MHEFWCDYVKPKYRENSKLHYMDTDSFIVYIKTEDISVDIVKGVETKFDTSNYELDGPLPNGRNKNVIGLVKDELGGKIMTDFPALRSKTFSYLTDDNDENKKAKSKKKKHKNCIIKLKLKFGGYQNCLEVTQLQNEIVLKVIYFQ